MPIYERLEPELGSNSIVLGHRSGPDRGSPSGLIESGHFSELSVRRFPWRRSYDTAEWLSFLQTQSDHHALPPERRARLLNAVGQAIDGLGGRFEMPHQAVLVSGRRL
jgi:hypothetical protein